MKPRTWSSGADGASIFSSCGPRAPTQSCTTAPTGSLMEEQPNKHRNMLGANGFKYKEQFGVIVMCRDEAEHRAVYERLKAEGYKCKVVRV